MANRDFDVTDPFDSAIIVHDREQVGENVVHVDGVSGEDVGPLAFRKLGARRAVEKRTSG